MDKKWKNKIDKWNDNDYNKEKRGAYYDIWRTEED